MHDEQEECMNCYCANESATVYPAKFSDQILYFCRDCLDLYEKKKCCYFCAQVYSDQNENFLDGQKWIGCDQETCEKWTHLICESKDGISGIEYLIEDNKYKYICPWCRIEDQKQRSLKQSKPFHKKELKFLDKISKRKNSGYEPPQQVFSNPPQVHFPHSISNKSSYLDELLKKNGGYSQQLSQEEMQVDLQKMMSLVKE